MHRVDTSDNIGALPTTEAAGTAGFFTKGNTGVNDSTVPGQDWFNMVQEELNNVVEQEGLTPDQTKADFTQLHQAIELMLKRSVPVGTKFEGYYSAPPDGFLELAGALLDRVVYSNLWDYVQALETADPGILVSDATWLGSSDNAGLFSTGDGSTTFRIPDFRDMFSRAKTGSRLLGSYEVDDFKSHDHGAGRTDTFGVSGSFGNFTFSNGTIPTNVTGGAETRPKNIALMFVIKY